MKQSHLFFKTRKETPADADSINASYLIRAGFVQKQMAGVYGLLPLGFRVIKKIEKIVREEMNAIDGQEILMNVLQPKELIDETGRWEEMKDILYKILGEGNKEIALAPTHEEQVTDIVRKTVKSYKDLPVYLYQIQTKFRNEPRAKSGLLRGREFIMKDMYSFSATEEDFKKYYEIAKKAYFKIFERFGLEAKFVEASGGVFSKASDEFQVLASAGEDITIFCQNCDFAQNKEISKLKAGDKCLKCGGTIKEENSIEVGNIFPLGTKYSSKMGAKFLDQKGKEQEIYMGCYGLGITRSLATVVEVMYDSTKNMMVWPDEIAPYPIHIISLKQDEKAEKLYKELESLGVSVLYDDRDISAGEKFAEADLIGCPYRVIVSEKSIKQGGVEFIDQKSGAVKILSTESAVKVLNEK